MASTARIFFAGIGTTFLILGVGFGGGLLLAKTAVHDQPLQSRANSESTRAVRVILPTSAEPATQAAVSEPIPVPTPKEVPAIEPQAPKADPKKAERDLKAERKRFAERKARRMVAMRVRQQSEQVGRAEPGLMAFDGDLSRPNLFGN